MNTSEKKRKIESLPSEADIHELLYELLPEMGYDDTTITHERGNLPENGKDLVASKFDAEENKKEWTAFVVKKGSIRGTSVGIQEIKAQILDCFNFSWHSLVKGTNIKINKVKAIISGNYTGGAIQKILADTGFNNPNISYWSAAELVSYIDKFLPRYWLQGSQKYKHYIEIFQNKNAEDDLVKALNISNKKIKQFIDYAIQPKLIEISITDQGDLRKRYYTVDEVARFRDCSLIAGQPGSGKSTLFKQLANDIIHENSIRNDYEFYPFILKFSSFSDSNFSVQEALKRHIQSNDFAHVGLDLEELLRNKNFILFIDALDELGTQELKEKALEAVQFFRITYPEIRIYCSSRETDSLIASCQKLKFRYLEITNVSRQQTETFISRYFNEDQVKCARLLKSLRDSHILDKLPHTPLTLALIASIFDENEIEIPATISDLYKHFVDLLLNRVITESTLDLLKVGIHKSALSYLAAYMHKSRIKQISKNQLIVLLRQFATDRGQTYSVTELVHDLIQNIGILIETERGEIEFKHLSFQEYFTAFQFYNHDITDKTTFIENFNDLWWQNVAIFYAGMTKDSPELLKIILEKNKPKKFAEYLVNLSGVGYLMQALYNTPIDVRVEGVRHNLLNAGQAAYYLLRTDEPEYDIIKAFFNTEYGVYKIISYWFEFHHNSITLKTPLERAFSEIISLLQSEEIEDTPTGPQRFALEYAGFLISTTLADIDDINFEHLKVLLDNTHPENNYVRGLIASVFDERYKSLNKEERKRKEIKKLKQKLDLLDHDQIGEDVNVKLITGKKIVSQRRGFRKKKK